MAVISFRRNLSDGRTATFYVADSQSYDPATDPLEKDRVLAGDILIAFVGGEQRLSAGDLDHYHAGHDGLIGGGGGFAGQLYHLHHLAGVVVGERGAVLTDMNGYPGALLRKAPGSGIAAETFYFRAPAHIAASNVYLLVTSTSR